MITRKIRFSFVYVLLTAFAFVLQATAQDLPPVPEYPPIPDYVVQDQITSPSLEGNQLPFTQICLAVGIREGKGI